MTPATSTFGLAVPWMLVDHEGKRYTICSDKAAESVRADPAKYLDGFSG